MPGSSPTHHIAMPGRNGNEVFRVGPAVRWLLRSLHLGAVTQIAASARQVLVDAVVRPGRQSLRIPGAEPIRMQGPTARFAGIHGITRKCPFVRIVPGSDPVGNGDIEKREHVGVGIVATTVVRIVHVRSVIR